MTKRRRTSAVVYGGTSQELVAKSDEKFNRVVRGGSQRTVCVRSESSNQSSGKKKSNSNAGSKTAVALSPNGQCALDYARRGLPVFPLPPRSKRPRAGSHGWQDATCDEAQIYAWWLDNPQYGIGIATGGTIVVLDIDGDCGKASLEKVVKMLGALPPTVQVYTPGKGGGKHLYFKTGGRALQNHVKIADGVDVRGEGGHAVAPPSQHPDGGFYRFIEGLSFDEIEVAELPPKWAQLLELGGKSAATAYYPTTPEGGIGTTAINLPANGREVSISITIR